MGLTLRLVAGLLLVLIGAVWALQGVGVIGGSVMTGSPFWLVVGLVLVVVGVTLVARRSAVRGKGHYGCPEHGAVRPGPQARCPRCGRALTQRV